MSQRVEWVVKCRSGFDPHFEDEAAARRWIGERLGDKRTYVIIKRTITEESTR